MKGGLFMSFDKDQIEELEDETVTLVLEDDTEVECDVLAIFPVDEKSYVALLPTSGPDADEGNVYLYRYTENENDEPEISDIEDESEFNAASEVFNELLFSEDEYDEIIDEEEL